MSEKGFRVEIPVHIKRDRLAWKVLAEREAPKSGDSVPRIARLLALAHKWEGLVRQGNVKNYAGIAKRIGMTKGRVAQVCSMVLLAPNIQETILNTNSSLRSRITTHALRQVIRDSIWITQRGRCGSSNRRLPNRTSPLIS